MSANAGRNAGSLRQEVESEIQRCGDDPKKLRTALLSLVLKVELNVREDWAAYALEADSLLKRAREACRERDWEEAAKFARELGNTASDLHNVIMAAWEGGADECAEYHAEVEA